MEVTQAKIVPLSREGDCHLMDRFRELGCFDDDELYHINACRIFLKVTTLSDITDATGRWITEEAYKGKPLTDRTSPLVWPRRPHVTRKQRKLWKQALETAFTDPGRRTLQQSCRLD
jgi:hypothetical protein